MVASEPTSFQSTASLPAAQREKSSEGENGRAHATMLEKGSAGPRKPRNREITSRYKSPITSSSPAPAIGRRFPSPYVDRGTNASDVTTPKRAQSAERRRPSPPRTGEAKVSNSSVDGTLVPKRVAGRSELLWPSTRSMSVSIQGEPYSPPSKVTPVKSQIESRGKSSSHASDQTLKPSANVVQKPADQRKGTPERKGTPQRRQSIDQAENARPLENVQAKPDQQRWPGTSNGKALGVASMSRSVDLSVDRERPSSRATNLLVHGKAAINNSRLPRPVTSSRALSQSINEGPAVSSSIRRTQVDSRGRSRESPIHTRKGSIRDALPRTGSPQHITTAHEAHVIRRSAQEAELASSDANASADNASDADGVYSGATAITSSTARGTPGSGTGARVARGTTVPARFWQDAAGKSRRLSDFNRLRSSMPESDLSTATGGKLGSRQKVASSAETQAGPNAVTHGFITSSPWAMSPNRSASAFSSPHQPLSPVKVGQTASPARSLPSPTRSRGPPLPLPGSSLQSSRSSTAAAMLSFGIDARKGKRGLTQLEEAHLHRILHNRLLQWRFVNARAEAAMNSQRLTAENLLYSVWERTSELRASVTMKRTQLQQARQAHKLHSILSAQVSKLEDWSSLQQEHSTALSGAIEALEAAILRVPVTGGVRADVQAVKEATSSAVDVMVAVESSVAKLLPKVEKSNCLVSELAQVAAQERALLDECGDLLAIASAFEVEEQSLRMHLIQLQQEKVRVLGHLLDSVATASDSVLLSSP